MLETGLKQWLNCKEEPSDFYQLVGLPRLCRDQARLLAAFQEASEYLFDFQNHKDKKTRDRARTFQLQVAEARRIVSDQGRWDKYDQDVIDSLRSLCRQNPSFSGPTAKLDDLRRWLALVQQVDSQRVEELVHLLRGQPNEPKKAKPPAETETLSSETAPTQTLGQPNRGLGASASGHTPGRAIPVSRSSALRQTPEEIPLQKKDVPPPPSRPSAPPSRVVFGKAPPPPPKETPRSVPVLPSMPPNQSLPPVVQPVPTSPANTTTLWIVMGIVLGVLCLGMLVLTIAWASGAFEGRRSRAGTSSVELRLFCQNHSGQTDPSFKPLKT